MAPSIQMLWVPLIVLYVILVALSICFVGAAVNVHFRDISAAMPVALSDLDGAEHSDAMGSVDRALRDPGRAINLLRRGRGKRPLPRHQCGDAGGAFRSGWRRAFRCYGFR